MAAVAVFALAVGGFVTALAAFVIFALTMGIIIFLLAWLGAAAGRTFARTLRLWGRRVQRVSAWLIIVIGAVLIYASANPGVLDRLLLPK